MSAFAPAGQRRRHDGGVATDAEPADRFVPRLTGVLAHAGAWGLAGGIAGLVALGIGTRLSMRLVALSSGTIGTGIRPESGAVPGELTADGTLFLVLAGTTIGAAIAAIIGVGLTRWIPRDGRWRTAAVWALGSLVPALGLIDPNNHDFALFGPTWFALLLFATCALGYGGLLTVVGRRTLALPRGRARGVCTGLGVPALALAFMAAIGLGTAGIGILLLVLLALPLLPRGGVLRWWWGDGVDRGGRLGLAGVILVALGWIVVRTGRILFA